MMNYAQVIAKLEQLKTGKNIADTEHILQLFSKISGKEGVFKILYLQNTFEDDSIGAFCESILKEHNKKVGRFTFFAWKRPCEHILVNQKNISQKEFAAIFEENFQDGKIDMESLTQKEVYFLMALFYFDKKACDYILLPKELKDTENKETEDIRNYKRTLLGQTYSIVGFEDLKINCGSKKDMENSVLSIRRLEQEGIILQEKLVRKALLKTKLEGRFEVLNTRPYVILDGADNSQATKILMANLQYFFPENPYIFVLGTLQDNYELVVRESAFLAQQIFTVTPPDIQNALPGIELAREVKKLNPNITNASSIEEAFEIVDLISGKDTVVIAFGSTALLDKCKTVATKK